jgi:S1-C subfamily serine protease
VERARASVVTVLTSSGQGSAFAFARAGRLLTNAHVVQGATSVTIVTASGQRVTGRVAAVDTTHDLAVIDAPVNLAPLPPRRTPAQAGEAVFGIGSPLGLQGSVVNGIVSAVRRGQPHDASIQTDLPINPGDSGGPLIDDRGRVIGVNESVLANARGISFAIPISDAAGLRAAKPAKATPAGTPILLIVAGAALAGFLLLVLVLTVVMRRRRQIRITLRPARAPMTYEPEPRVRLKPHEE